MQAITTSRLTTSLPPPNPSPPRRRVSIYYYQQWSSAVQLYIGQTHLAYYPVGLSASSRMGSSPPPQDRQPDTRIGSIRLDANDEHTSSAPPSPSSDLHTSPRASSDSSPPFWLTRHDRSISTVSYQSIVETRPAPISLEDHSSASHEQSLGCWARSVTVDEYVIVSGPTGIGAYLVWNCSVATLKGGVMSIRKRYSEFDRLRTNLIKAFPYSEASIPPLPRKSVVSRFRPEFLEHRKNGLNHFMNCILLNPEFAASPILKDFIFS
nr:hypothetical protein B0A51_01183 [Rachicladosporium sp. CCFEE 5018]